MIMLAIAFKLVKEKYGTKIAAVIHLAAYFDFTGQEKRDKKPVDGIARFSSGTIYLFQHLF